MAITILEDYLICILLGMGIGVIGSWLYMRSRIKSIAIGQVIETAMIERNVYELGLMSRHLTQIVSRIQECSEELNSKIDNFRDIELDLASLPELEENIEEIELPLKLEIIEKNE